MKAVVYTQYGAPEVLQLKEVEKPVPKDNEVLVKVYATTVTATDCTFRKGKPVMTRLFTGLRSPKRTVLGNEFAGEIEFAGKEVKSFKKGDRIFGSLRGYGAYAEYLCLPEEGTTMVNKPANKTYEESIACCDGFLTALPLLRDRGNIRSGHQVLVVGASGSVGSAAVQLANYLGAEVTGVCSAANMEMVKSIGAGKVIDYNKQDLTKSGQTFDIIFDTTGKISFSRGKSLLKEKGIFIETNIGLAIFPHVLWTALFGSKKARVMATGLRPPREKTKDLAFIAGLIEAEKIKPVIDRTYPMEQIAEAHRYVDKGHKKGNVVITVNHN
jgi:NADPH:quinone reductase-like Zn-dependent oxidoreductase